MTGNTTALDCALLADGSLRLAADTAAEAQVRYWLPRLPVGTTARKPDASIAVALRDAAAARPTPPPAMRLDPVDAWTPAADTVTLHARDDALTGTVDLARLEATLLLTPDAARAVATPHEPRNAAVFSALTLASALLLNRMRRALLHAAAVVAPDGRAWLLVGNAFAGKTTTTVNLIRSGWDWISDDTVVLGRADNGEVVVEGWPRDFHLDRGYLAGESTGERDAVDPVTFGPGEWRRGARLGGVLFPQVVPDAPTQTSPVTPADALARLIRQSPWLLADPAAARDVLALLTATVSPATLELRLGRDSYQDPARLVRALAAVGTI